MNEKTLVKLVLVFFFLIQLILMSNIPAVVEHLDSIMTAVECEVTITPPSVSLEVGEFQVFAASSTCNGDIISGTYTWSVDGGTLNTISGDEVVYTADEEGEYTLMVTDTANHVTATATLEVYYICWTDIILLTDDVYRSRWLPLPALITIEGICTNFSVLTRRPEYTPEKSSLSVIPLMRLLNEDTQIINQIVLIMPSILTGVGFDGRGEIVEVSVEGLPAYFWIKMLPYPF